LKTLFVPLAAALLISSSGFADTAILVARPFELDGERNASGLVVIGVNAEATAKRWRWPKPANRTRRVVGAFPGGQSALMLVAGRGCGTLPARNGARVATWT
jgi:hypothetical protein